MARRKRPIGDRRSEYRSTITDSAELALIQTLLAYDARPATIQELTGARIALVRQIASQNENFKIQRGRTTESVGRLMHRVLLHLECGLYLSFYSSLYDYSRDAALSVVVDALRLQRTAMQSPSELPVEVCVMLAKQYASKAVVLARCPKCSLRYMRSVEPVLIGGELGRGECPYCRVSRAAPSRPAEHASP